MDPEVRYAQQDSADLKVTCSRSASPGEASESTSTTRQRQMISRERDAFGLCGTPPLWGRVRALVVAVVKKRDAPS